MVYSQYMAGVGLIITIIILKTLSFVTHGVFSQCEKMYHKPCPYNLLHTVCEIKNELLTATPNQKHPYCSWKWPWKTQCGTWCKWWNTLEGEGGLDADSRGIHRTGSMSVWKGELSWWDRCRRCCAARHASDSGTPSCYLKSIVWFSVNKRSQHNEGSP